MCTNDVIIVIHNKKPKRTVFLLNNEKFSFELSFTLLNFESVTLLNFDSSSTTPIVEFFFLWNFFVEISITQKNK